MICCNIIIACSIAMISGFLGQLTDAGLIRAELSEFIIANVNMMLVLFIADDCPGLLCTNSFRRFRPYLLTSQYIS